MSGAERPSAVITRISRSRGVSTGRSSVARSRISSAIPAWISGESTVPPRATDEIASQIVCRLASLERYAAAPAATARYTTALSRYADRNTTRVGSPSRVRAFSTSVPSSPGIFTSSTATRAPSRFSSSSAARPSEASPTSSRSGRSLMARTTPSRYSGWSSATNTRVLSELTWLFVSGDFRRDTRLAADLDQRLADLLARGVLAEVAGGAGAQGTGHEVRVEVGADHHDASGGTAARHALAQLDAAEHRHLHVDERDVGTQLRDQPLRLRAVGGLAEQLELGGGRDPPPQAVAIERMVVGHDDADPPLGGAGFHQDEHRGAVACRPSRAGGAAVRVRILREDVLRSNEDPAPARTGNASESDEIVQVHWPNRGSASTLRPCTRLALRCSIRPWRSSAQAP